MRFRRITFPLVPAATTIPFALPLAVLSSTMLLVTLLPLASVPSSPMPKFLP
jgi:hypothetical protein